MTSLFSQTKLMLAAFAMIVVALLAGCGGGGGGSAGGDGGGGGGGNWYYHFSCNGDPACLSTNYAGTASGTSNQGPVYAMCSSLLTFAAINWNMPPATNSCSQSATPPPATLVSITVSPANKGLPIGLTQQYKATGNYSDGTSKDITALVTWYAPPAGIGEPRPPVVASIDASGLATATTAGTITITATLGAISGNTKLYVSAATLQSITISPANPTINQYLTQQFTATGHYSDGSTQILTSANWDSGTPAVATIGASGRAAGLAAGIAAGTSTITVTFGAFVESTTVTVTAVSLQSISVTPANPGLAKGTTRQFTATGFYSDGSVRNISGQALWSSSAPTVADIDTTGTATGLTLGTATITATFSGLAGDTLLTVTAAALQSISIAPPNPSIIQGHTQQFSATGTFSDGSTQDITSLVTWSSGTITVATIDASGLSTGLDGGTALITAAQGTISASTTLTVVIPGVNWIQAPFGGSNYTAVTWSGTEFVAVGTAGFIAASPDGSNWTTRTSGTTNDINAVIKAGTQLVAVGAAGTILTSPDGITWTTRTSGTTNTLNAAVWTGSKIYAVGAAMTTLSSPNGTDWTSLVPSAPGNDFSSIAWSGSTFVEGLVGAATHMTSPDAITFTTHASQPFNGAIWTGTQFVVVADSGFIYLSPDGFTWSNPSSGTTNNLRAVAWSGYQYAAVGNGGTILTSPDAITWTPRGIWADRNVRGVAWSGEHFVVVTEGGLIFVSTP